LKEKVRKRQYSAEKGFFDPLDNERGIKKEKEKARALKQSGWWMRKIQEGICYYCQRRVGRENLTMDHIVPLSRGGQSKRGNIVAACKECNNKKKYLLPIEWDEYVRSLKQGSESQE
jgi:5-methylcytosine-specific restriction endonuclease McrA